MLSLIQGDGHARPDPHHYQSLLKTARVIEHGIARPRSLQELVERLTPIERGVVAVRMTRDGFSEEAILSVLASSKSH